MNIFDWDELTDREIFYYCLGRGNIVRFDEGWDYTYSETELYTRIWMEEEE